MYSAAIRGGLIEAQIWKAGKSLGFWYSAAIRGGLIEARLAALLSMLILRIPPRFAAASLKPGYVAGQESALTPYSAAIRGGLIEAVKLTAPAAVALTYSAAIRGGLIEALCDSVGIINDLVGFRRDSRRPH